MCAVLLYYYIFVFGFPEVDCADFNIISDKPCILIHEGIVYSSLFITLFFLLILFGDYLEPVNRHYVVRYYHVFLRSVRRKAEEGRRLHREWKGRHR